MVFLSGGIIEHRPQELVGLCKGCVIEGVAAEVGFIELFHKAVTGLVRENHLSPARTGNAEARSTVLAALREAVVCCTELAAKMRRVFTAITDIHTAGSHTCKDCTAVRSNERISGGDHVFREARIG